MKLKKITYVSAMLIVIATFIQDVYAIASYKAAPLEDFISQIYVIKPNSLAFAYKVFDEVDCEEFLGRSNILSHGYLPIQLNIENNSDRYLVFSLDNISFPCVSCNTITKKVKFSTFKRIFSWGVPALFLNYWLIDFILYDRVAFRISAGLPFTILAIIEAIKSPRANKQLEDDYSVKALHDQVIRPHSGVNGIVFVKKEDFDYSFTFGLIDQLTGERYVLSPEKNQIKL